jgi:hypothetical protein
MSDTKAKGCKNLFAVKRNILLFYHILIKKEKYYYVI